HAPAEAPDRLAGLPLPLPAAGRCIVLLDLAGRRQPERHGVIGDLVGAPVAGGGRDLDAGPRGGVDVAGVGARAGAGDDPAMLERFDGARADGRVLTEDAVRVVRGGDDIVLALALRLGELEPRTFDDRAFDVDLAEVVVEDHDLDVPNRLGRHAVRG